MSAQAAQDQQTPGQHPTSFRVLLYRYLFFGWLFRDVRVGNLLERAAAWRHNCHQSRWLPTYARRWAVVGLACYGLGALSESLLPWQALSALFYVPGTLALPVNAVIAVLWLGLKLQPGPF